VSDSVAQEVRTRRAVLAAAAGGAAALAVAAIRPSDVAAAPANMQTETDNATTAATGVSNSTDASGQLALFGHGTGAGGGLEGTSGSAIGAVGVSADPTDPATNVRNAGVVGVAGSIDSVAANIGLTGVYGYSDPSPVDNFVGAGVWGDSGDIGVIGTGAVGVLGDAPIGVVGVGDASGGAGVQAEAAVASAVSLRVIGRAEFSRSGHTTVSAGASKRTVTLAGCTASSLIIAVLSSNRSGRWVRAVVPASGSFTIYLNTTVTSSTQIAWIAFTNPVNHGG
jgi:hypothetical protein